MLARRITIDERALESRRREAAQLRLVMADEGAPGQSPARRLHALIEERLTADDGIATPRLSRGVSAIAIVAMSGALWAAISGLARLV